MNLKELMKDHGYNNRSLAKELGVSENSVYLWKYGKSRPKFSNISKMAKIFGRSAETLIIMFIQ